MTTSHKGSSNMFIIDRMEDDIQAIKICREFIDEEIENRYVFGRNEYAKSIANQVDVGFFIDDFTEETEFMGRPIIKTEDISEDGIVVIAVTLGRPITVDKKLSAAGIKHLSYFSFYKYSGLDLLPVTFWDKFKPDFEYNEDKYNWVFELLEDNESKRIFEKLINFRLSGDLSYMSGFTDRQREQYFESFLGLKEKGEVFADVGGFDGFTSIEFIKRCPKYRGIYIFEPYTNNMDLAKSRLRNYGNINYIQKGLSNKNEILRLSIAGSGSVISKDGEVEIEVDTLDNFVKENTITFIKMDIEGAEGEAISGAIKTISRNHPKLALSVYHKADDLWKIPEQVLSIRHDYKVYLRHYTEGVTETVMFFVPN